MPERQKNTLRSQRWYAGAGMRGFAPRQHTQQMGLRRDEVMGRPVIAILNTWGGLSPGHIRLRDRAEAAKRGVWQAGGSPVELPVHSVGEVMAKPTTLLHRNLLSMEADEEMQSDPVDRAVLLGTLRGRPAAAVPQAAY